MSTKQERVFQDMSKVLPEGWVKIKLIDIVDLNLKAHLDDSLEVGFTPMASVPISFREQAIYEKKQWKDVKKGYTHFKNGDVIFAKITPCFENSKAAIIENYPNKHGAGSTEYFVLTPKEQCIHPKLLLALVKSKDFLIQGALNMSGSVGHKRVPKEFVENYSFFLPPLAEQQEIAARLDDLLAQVDAIKVRLDAIPAILKRFRQAVLAAAIQPKEHSDWQIKAFSSLVKEMRNGLSPQPNDQGKGYKILRISSVRSFLVDLTDYKYLECDGKIKELYQIKSQDLLFTRYNGSLEFVGVCGRYKEEKEIYLYPDKLIRVRVDISEILPEFVEIFFATPQTRKVVTDFVKSTSGQKGISGGDLKSVQIHYPAIKEQTEIVNRVEQLFAFADQIEQQVQAAQTRVNQLTQAILAKAFKGELTAAWRAAHPELISGEHSAEALLEKIKATQASIKPKRGSLKLAI